MSWKTVIIIIIVLLAAFGLSRFFGVLEQKQESSSNYLQETVGAIDTVKELKKERAETLEKQESSLEDNE